MKKTLLVAAILGAAVLSACGQKSDANATTKAAATTAMAEEKTMAADGKKSDATEKDMKQDTAEASVCEGTLEVLKDFQFEVKTEDGESVLFSFDEKKKPKGIEDVKVGDKVEVTYTGTVSEVDPFEGEVLSVKKK